MALKSIYSKIRWDTCQRFQIEYKQLGALHVFNCKKEGKKHCSQAYLLLKP